MPMEKKSKPRKQSAIWWMLRILKGKDSETELSSSQTLLQKKLHLARAPDRSQVCVSQNGDYKNKPGIKFGQKNI